MKYALSIILSIAIAVFLYMQFGDLAFGGSYTSNESLTGQVIAVVDGDSIKVETGLTVYNIELIGIDAPEIGQKFGNHAVNYLSELVNKRSVMVDLYQSDRFGNFEGELFLDGVSINKLLLQDGFAWARRDIARGSLWSGLESLARDQNFGLWRNDNPMPPWKFRENVLAGM